jgi:cardiolipin synthase
MILNDDSRNKNCKLFTTAAATWEAMLEDCRNAQSSIYFEQYIFVPDSMGKQFLDVFKEKARQGVTVKVLLDCIGSKPLYFAKNLRAELAEAGVEVRWYNVVIPWLLHRAASYYFRDHRKLMTVDSTIGYVGGVCVRADMGSWRDTQARLNGPVVGAIEQSFLQLWEKNAVSLPHLLDRPRSGTNGRVGGYAFIPNSPAPGKRFLYHAMREAVRNAQQRIWLTVPYFVPDLGLFRNLRLAAKRGLDVRVIVPKVSDLPALDIAGRSYFGMALKAGIKLYTYQTSVLHAKVLICDDNWATFGSMNWDSMSFRYNLEGNIVTTNKTTIAELSEHFLADIATTPQLSLDQWHKRPLKQKLAELLLWPFHSLL